MSMSRFWFSVSPAFSSRDHMPISCLSRFFRSCPPNRPLPSLFFFCLFFSLSVPCHAPADVLTQKSYILSPFSSPRPNPLRCTDSPEDLIILHDIVHHPCYKCWIHFIRF